MRVLDFRLVLKTAGLAIVVYLLAVPSVYLLTGVVFDALHLSQGTALVMTFIAQALLWISVHFSVGYVIGHRVPSARIINAAAAGFVFDFFFLGITVVMYSVIASAFCCSMQATDWAWTLLLYVAILLGGIAISSLGWWASTRHL